MTHKRSRIIGAVAVTMCMVSLGVSGGFWYLVELHKANLWTHQEQEAAAKAHEAGLAELVLTMENTREERDSLDRFILKDDGVIDFLSLIEMLGREQGVKLEKSGLVVSPLNETFETMKMNITVTGQYDTVLRILSLLETMPYQSMVTKASIESADDGTWRGVYEFEITKFKKI